MEKQKLSREDVEKFFELKQKIDHQCVYLLEQITGKKNLECHLDEWDDPYINYDSENHIVVMGLNKCYSCGCDAVAYGEFTKDDLAFPVIRINKERIKGE